MKTRGILALLMGVALVAGACGDAADDSTLDPLDDAPATEPAPPAAGLPQAERGAEQMMSGTIGKVDADARTFTINANNREETFRYSESTNVTGAPGVQGLAGRDGTRVTVHYREEAGAMMATRIMLEGAGSEPSSSQPSLPPR